MRQKAKKKVVPVVVREVKVGQTNAQNAPVVSQPKQQVAEVSSSVSTTKRVKFRRQQQGLSLRHLSLQRNTTSSLPV